jgi:galacturan 1,4-alpha-galacturonidase
MEAPFLMPGSFGARGDGHTKDTLSIQAAIDTAAKKGGGTVFFPPGKYLTGTIFLRSNVTLYLEGGATILGSQDCEDFPLVESRWEGKTLQVYAPLLFGVSVENVAIEGRGKIDGQGEAWWERFRAKKLAHPRPRCISFQQSKNILLRDISVENSPGWTIHPLLCEGVAIQSVRICNPPDSPNTDGIDPDSCRDVRISDCHITTGDDCIAIKAGTEAELPALRIPCEDIAITNCTMERGHGGVVIGSEMSGGIRNVVVSNCIFKNTDRGIRLKTRRGRGGRVENIRVSNIIMRDVLCPITLNMYYGCGAWGIPRVFEKKPYPVDEGTPTIRSVHLSGITASGVKLAAAFLYGLAENPATDIRLTDIVVELDSEYSAEGEVEMAEGFPLLGRAGVFARFINQLSLSGVLIHHSTGVPFHLEDLEGGEIHRIESFPRDDGVPMIQMVNVRGMAQ